MGIVLLANRLQAPRVAFEALIASDSQRGQMADKLWELLNAACRTSSMVEAINGLLKQFLHNHQAFRRPETLQLYLNLLFSGTTCGCLNGVNAREKVLMSWLV